MTDAEAIAAAVDYARAHPEDPNAVAFLVEIGKLRESFESAALDITSIMRRSPGQRARERPG